MATKEIFELAPIGAVNARNRIIRSATNDHLGNRDGSVSDAEIEMYDTLSRNEVGTIITGHISVSPALALRADEVQLCIGSDEYILGLSRIAATIRRNGAVAIAQLSMAGPKGLTPFDFNTLETREIETIRQQFVSAAVRAAKAGFDGVQIHVAHWYLLQAMANVDLNHRTDRYGGTPENCIRLAREIVEGIRRECGVKFVIAVKLNAHNTQNAVDDFDLLEYYGRTLTEAGADLLEISGADFARKDRKAELYYLDYAGRLKEAIPSVAVALVGGLYNRASISKALESVDFASLSRALLTQPDFVARMHSGAAEASRCVHCNKCFEIFATKYERCVFGPVLPKLESTFGHPD